MGRVLREMRRYPRAAEAFERDARSRWDEARVLEWTSLADTQLAAEFEWHLAHATERRVPLLMANMVAAAEYEQLVALATRCAGDEGPSLAARALGNIGGIQTNDAIDALGDVVTGEITRDAWVARYGFRGPVEYELASHPWGEDVAYVDALLEQARHRDLTATTDLERAAAASRKELARLAGIRRPLLAALLRSLERHLRWRENAKIHEVLAVARLRLAARECSARLVGRGGIDEPDDGWFLTAQETISDIALASPPNRRDRCRPATRRERRGRRDRAARALPREARSTRRGTSAADPSTRPRPSQRARCADRRRCPARHRSLARNGHRSRRVVVDPYRAELEPGEVLVAHTTDPAWTPLFLTAGAVVIDLGGPLSHGAVIARELGIPCVINVKHASTQLAAGPIVTVDGAAGEVRSRPAPV